MEVMAILGARAGSKGLPGKNIRPLLGHPLLSWAIAVGRAARRVDRVILSTDSEEYARIARSYGADTPFLRPAEHATDTAIDYSYIRHAVEWLDANEGYRPDIVIRLCPTAPLIRPDDVDRCIDLLAADPAADSAIIMTPAREHPRKAVKYAADGVHVISYITERGVDVAPTNRQSYEQAFNRQGLPVASRRATLLEQNSQTGNVVLAHIIDPGDAFDVDDELDFRLIESVLSMRGDPPPQPIPA